MLKTENEFKTHPVYINFCFNNPNLIEKSQELIKKFVQYINNNTIYYDNLVYDNILKYGEKNKNYYEYFNINCENYDKIKELYNYHTDYGCDEYYDREEDIQIVDWDEAFDQMGTTQVKWSINENLNISTSGYLTSINSYPRKLGCLFRDFGFIVVVVQYSTWRLGYDCDFYNLDDPDSICSDFDKNMSKQFDIGLWEHICIINPQR